MSGFWALFKQDIHKLISSSGTLVILLIFPTVLILLMGFLFEKMYTTALISSYDFYGVTLTFFIAMMAATVPANIFLEKGLRSANTRIFYSPVSRVSIYVSKILACWSVISIALCANIIVLQMTSLVNFGGDRIFYVIVLMISFVLFLTMLSSAICVTVHSEEITNIIISNTMSVLGFLSGIFFPIASLGVVFEKIANFSPIKWTVDCVFELIYDGKCDEYWLIVLGLFIVSLLLLWIVHKNYRPEDYI